MITVVILLLVNAAGFLFRMYNLDPYVVLIGFRFHLSLTLPVLFLLNESYRTRAADKLKHPGKFAMGAVCMVLLSGIIVFFALYSTEILKLTDPDYFYELGLSSIIDLPVYLVWNLPHILILTLFISVISEKKAGYLIALAVFFLLFAYMLIPFGKDTFNIVTAAKMLTASVVFALIIYKIRNVYLASCLIFLSIWLYVLVSGSSSGELLGMFLGHQYNSWEGFLAPGKEWKSYIFFFYIGLELIFILAYVLINAYNNRAVKNSAL